MGMRQDGEGRGDLPRCAGPGDVAPERAASLAWVLHLQTLEEVLRRDLQLVEVVTQDEYTNDVVTRSGDVYVVFDTT